MREREGVKKKKEGKFKVFFEARRIETFAHTSASSSTSSFVFSTGIVIGTDTSQLKALPQEDIPTEVKLQACGTWERSLYACLVVKHVFQPLSIPLAVPAGVMIASLASGTMMGRVCGEAMHTTAPEEGEEESCPPEIVVTKQETARQVERAIAAAEGGECQCDRIVISVWVTFLSEVAAVASLRYHVESRELCEEWVVQSEETEALVKEGFWRRRARREKGSDGN
ncbi:uncharacterized protein MONOS_15962 [Monocercomonoides exilis]|uniref:uncharacterized protein n=1 Tax=Monocercomonoides exilis TaxID=2049356 RepID=UPI003559A0E8|nr:hypothetical protein MONOS_15962 [Monocercomonoides exilis]|eukprot:MONOS_15962.1-p1 / transcript=MONOS_15962.1 / gene=MONOS_15962 / organism=Monocercomonoides_exilis_PA203 / gene_product=unspecified product / transcript_product=unspecified product / location=Mono_scaffold01430:3878-5161(+) / protein_length=225 / sequence_SO=supercontig / SO=protein_coding / is_pseudo=false